MDKLKCLDLNSNKTNMLHSLPLSECLDRIIFDNEDDITLGPEDPRLYGHRLRVFLAKNLNPPLIFVHIDGKYAALYSYFDEEFSRRSDIHVPA